MRMRIKFLSVFIILTLVSVICISAGSSELVSEDKFEPNDNIKNATSIEVGNSYNGLSVNQSDVDYYHFTATKSGTYIVETYESGNPPADTKIEVLLPNGRIHESDSNSGTGNFSKTMTSVILTNGKPTELYIKITEESNDKGYYGIKISYNPSKELGEGASGGFRRTPGFEIVFAATGVLAGLYLFKRGNN